MKKSIHTALKAGVAPLVLGTALLATPAFAADDAKDTKDTNTIVVTGTITRNPAAATASPVVSLSAEDISKRGITTMADFAQSLTANNAGTNPNSWSGFGFATGASAPSLRGLNDAYTLTIFNGMRTATYPLADDGYRNFVDINSIPSSIVERVDVLQDGASATYGSDAVAGVINVIVKKQITGLHLDMSNGISQRGDAGEHRVSATFGYGKLDEQGFNAYANIEWQRNDSLMLSDRGFPFNTADQSSICNAAGSCLSNSVRNGIQADGSYNGFTSTRVPFVRPYSTSGSSLGGYQLLNPSAGCQGLTAVTLTSAQRAGTVTPATVCQQDLVNQYRQYSPQIERLGANARFTKTIGDRAEAYLMVNYYNVKTNSITTPSGYTGQTAAGGTQKTVSSILLPAYVCSSGTSSIVGSLGSLSNVLMASGCNASNGTLNPNNPYAASGNLARLVALPSIPRTTHTDAKTFRISGAVDGSFGKDWQYHVAGTMSSVALDVAQNGYINLQGLMNAVAQGTYNFVDPTANSVAATQIVFPTNRNHSISKLTEFAGTLAKDVFDLPGGALNVAIAAQYRYEAIHAPSANAPNEANPYNRYYGINAAGVEGSRTVWSTGYEISAPVFKFLKLKAEGNYDHYSTGQSAFSPKFEAEFKPIKEVKFRGTFSRGFRAPSFSEAFSLPTTGYVTAQINCGSATYAAFCAAHSGNPSYYSGGYSYGLTSQGNSKLSPEKSTSVTAGIVFQPTSRLTFTADYWSIKISNVIVPVQATADMLTQYYTNNGVVNIPGITVTQAPADQQNQSALPLLGTIQGSYKNADSFIAKGIDFSGTVSKLRLGHSDVLWTSRANASLLLKLAQTNEDGSVSIYDGTLGPCNITSCSGAPRWRVTWQNTFDIGEHYSFTLTGSYTSGYSSVATDSGGVYGNCQASADNGQLLAYGDGTPVQCNSKSVFTLDGHGEIRINEHVKFYGDIKNMLNSRPSYEPNAGYGLYQFNPAWSDSQFIGRYFRVGAKFDF